MTRITNLGRKRTYLEAGFGNGGDDQVTEAAPGVEAEAEAEEAPKKKPRKRRRKGKGDVQPEEGPQDVPDTSAVAHPDPAPNNKARKEEKRKRAEEKAASSERRRLKRTAERDAHKTCLACRKLGHTARDCPEATAGKQGKSVGLCYRCGSTRHNLSRCKKPANQTNPLPFASCFVCSETGHLASSCPQNKGKGVYPNGGSCKLCGQTSHLARDCELRTREDATKSGVMLGDVRGPGEGGADEDDFHVLKRRRDAVLREEKEIADSAAVVKPKPKIVVFQ